MLHDPYANATPSQLKYALARSARLGKIAAAAPSPPQTDPPKEPVFTHGEWMARQFEIHPLQKSHWFSVEEDLGSIDIVRPKIDEIQRVVCNFYEINKSEMISVQRNAYLVRARHVAMYLSKKLTLRSLPEIGRRFGGRDHTTVLSALRRIESLLKHDEKLQVQVRHLSEILGVML